MYNISCLVAVVSILASDAMCYSFLAKFVFLPYSSWLILNALYACLLGHHCVEGAASGFVQY